MHGEGAYAPFPHRPTSPGIPTSCMLILLLQNWTGLLAHPNPTPQSHSFPLNPPSRNEILLSLAIPHSTRPPNPASSTQLTILSTWPPELPLCLPSVFPPSYLSTNPPSQSPRSSASMAKTPSASALDMWTKLPRYHVDPPLRSDPTLPLLRMWTKPLPSRQSPSIFPSSH
jgi:hypothetical protein